MAFHDVEKLPQLVGLGLTAAGLQVDRLADDWMPVDVVTAPNPVQLEAERLGEALGVSETDVGQLAMS